MTRPQAEVIAPVSSTGKEWDQHDADKQEIWYLTFDSIAYYHNFIRSCYSDFIFWLYEALLTWLKMNTW